MRKTFFALTAALLLAACTGKAPEKGALIEGDVLGYEQNDKYLAILFEFIGPSRGKGIQEDTLRDGHFSFRLDSLAGDHYNIAFADIADGRFDILNTGPMLYLEPGSVVRIQGEGKYFGIARVDSPSREQKLQGRLLRMTSAEYKARRDAEALYRQVRNELRAGKDLTPAQVDSLQAVAKQIDATISEIGDKFSQQELKALETAEVGQYALGRLRSLAEEVSKGREEYRKVVRRIYERLSDEQKASYCGAEIRSYLNIIDKVDVGAPVPDYGFVDLDGSARRLSDLPGKWLLLDFWERGCLPCSRSVPELGELSREFEDKLAVVSISPDDDANWRKALEEHGIFWNNWRDPAGLAGIFRAFGTDAFPTFVLVSPDGIIRGIHVGYTPGSLRELTQPIN